MSLDISPLEVCWVRLAATHRGAPMSDPVRVSSSPVLLRRITRVRRSGRMGRPVRSVKRPAHQSLGAQADLDDPAVEGVVQLAANAVEHHAPVLGDLGLRGVEPLLEVHEGVDRQPGDALAVSSRQLPVGGDAGSRHRGDGLHHQHARVLRASPAGWCRLAGRRQRGARTRPARARRCTWPRPPGQPSGRGRSCRGLGEYRGTHGLSPGASTRPEGGHGQECATPRGPHPRRGRRQGWGRVEPPAAGCAGWRARRDPGAVRRSRRRP